MSRDPPQAAAAVGRDGAAGGLDRVGRGVDQLGTSGLRGGTR